MKFFVKLCGILLRKMTYNKQSNKKRKFIKVSTTRILYVPNIYLIIFHLIYHIRSFVYNDKTVNVLQCCNGRYRSVSRIVKKSVSLCHVCPHGTSRILDVLL